MPLARGAAGVHVDGDQRLGLVEHQVAARAELHRVGVHGVELAFDLVALEQRNVAVLVELHLLGVARRQRLHEVLGRLVARSEEHTSELQSLMRISYAVFCLNKKKKSQSKNSHRQNINYNSD